MSDENMGSVLNVVPNKTALAEVSDFLDRCLEENGVSLRLGYKLKIMADELFSNVIYYSGADRAEILFRCDGGKISMRISDNGSPYNPLETGEPDFQMIQETKKEGGLGIFMVKKMADAVEYEYSAGENRTTVILSCGPESSKKN